MTEAQIKTRLLMALFRLESAYFRDMANALSKQLFALTGEYVTKVNGHITFAKVAA